MSIAVGDLVTYVNGATVKHGIVLESTQSTVFEGGEKTAILLVLPIDHQKPTEVMSWSAVKVNA
tara:strand:- start:37 stop:228 length:192 start_codon:yes stop_codon:yes gene_type:complete